MSRINDINIWPELLTIVRSWRVVVALLKKDSRSQINPGLLQSAVGMQMFWENVVRIKNLSERTQEEYKRLFRRLMVYASAYHGSSQAKRIIFNSNELALGVFKLYNLRYYVF